MKDKKGTILASIFMVAMLVIGITGYSQGKKDPETPIRILYKTAGGNVFFDHKSHLAENGDSFDCTDCHHAYEGDDMPLSCAECHEVGAEESSRAEVLHNQCKGCHESEEKGPVKCHECHLI